MLSISNLILLRYEHFQMCALLTTEHFTPSGKKKDRQTQRHSHTPKLIFSQSHTKPQLKKRFVLNVLKKKKTTISNSKHIRPCQRRHQFLQGKMAFGDELR